MKEDPIVEEVRAIRETLSEKFNFDVQAIFKDLRERQVELGNRLTLRKTKETSDKPSDPDRNSTPPHPGR